MNVIIRKRQIIMSALVLALGSAVFVNWYFTKPEVADTALSDSESKSYSVLGEAQYVSSSGEKTTQEETAQADSLASSRLERSRAHDEAFEKLNKIINSSTAAKTAIDSAAQQLAELTDTIKLEADIDALIKAKCGFDCITAINDGSAEVICESGKLNSTAILQIKEIITKHADINTENIIIFEQK